MAIVIQIERINIGDAAEATVTETFSRDELTLGRASTNDVVLKAPDVSGSHAKLQLKDGSLYITDLNSSNGTYLEDTAIPPGTETALPDNGRLIIGSFVLTAIFVEDTDATEEMPLPESPEALPEEEEVPQQAANTDEAGETEEAVNEQEVATANGAEVDDALFDKLLGEGSWSELIIQNFEELIVEEGEGFKPARYRFSSEEACESALRELIEKAGLSSDGAVCEGLLENDISFRAILPPTASRSCAVFTRFSGSERRIGELVTSGFLAKQGAEFLLNAIRFGHSVIICGAEGSGKTTLLGAVAAEFFESRTSLVLQEKNELRPDPRATFVTLPATADENESAAAIRAIYNFVGSLRPQVLFVSNCRSTFDAEIFNYLGKTPSIVACFNSASPEAFLADLRQDWREKLGRQPRLILQLKRFPDGSRALTRISAIRSQDGALELEELMNFVPVTAESRADGKLEVVGDIESWQTAEVGRPGA